MSGYKNILVTALAAALVLPVSAQAAKKTITFMELNDLHAHLVPHTDVVADGNGGTKVAMRGASYPYSNFGQTDSCRKS